MSQQPPPIALQEVELADRLRQIDERLDRGSERMDLMQAELKSNTDVTTEVREILSAVRTGLRVLGGLGTAAQWAGRLAAAAVALWGAFYALTHGGRPPGSP